MTDQGSNMYVPASYKCAGQLNSAHKLANYRVTTLVQGVCTALHGFNTEFTQHMFIPATLHELTRSKHTPSRKPSSLHGYVWSGRQPWSEPRVSEISVYIAKNNPGCPLPQHFVGANLSTLPSTFFPEEQRRDGGVASLRKWFQSRLVPTSSRRVPIRREIRVNVASRQGALCQRYPA